MEKPEALKIAKRHVSYGYFEVDATEAYIRCPECRTHVTIYRNPWEKWKMTALIKALQDHLMEDH